MWRLDKGHSCYIGSFGFVDQDCDLGRSSKYMGTKLNSLWLPCWGSKTCKCDIWYPWGWNKTIIKRLRSMNSNETRMGLEWDSNRTRMGLKWLGETFCEWSSTFNLNVIFCQTCSYSDSASSSFPRINASLWRIVSIGINRECAWFIWTHLKLW